MQTVNIDQAFDQALADYDFGKDVVVTDTGSWSYTTPGNVRSCKVYVEGFEGFEKHVLNFTVKVDLDTGEVLDAYALDEKGQAWGKMA